MQTVNILNGAENKPKKINTFVINCNTFCWSGGNCILNINQPKKLDICI